MNFKQLVLMNLQALTNFPYIEKDFDAVTDYELLCKVVDHLNEVIKNSNEQNTVIQNLYNAFVALKDYVDNYFDNLDIQEEIDNKLDEMAKSGELADIIAQYLEVASVLGFDTKASLKSADNLVNGSITRTLGESTYNDGKGSYYKIRTITSSDVIDDNNILALSNYPTLIAEKIENYYINKINNDIEIISTSPINVLLYGAKNDGITDNYNVLQNLINNNPHKTLYFPDGTYLISNTLNIPTGNEHQINIEFSRNAILKTSESITSLISVGANEDSYNRYAEGSIVSITGVILDGTNTDRVIYLSANQKQTHLSNITILNANNYGIYCDTGTNTSDSGDNLIENLSINGKSSDYNCIGLYLVSSDNKIIDTRINKCKTGVYCIRGNVFENVHVIGSWETLTPSTEDFDKTTAFIFDGWGLSMLTNCYADTMATGFEIIKQHRVNIKNSIASWWYSDTNGHINVFKCDSGSMNQWYFHVDGFDVGIPANGTIKGINLDSIGSQGRNFLGTFDSIKLSNISIQNTQYLADDDYLFNRAIYTEPDIVTHDPWSQNAIANEYYPVALLKAGQYDFKFRMGNDQLVNVKANVGSTPNIQITNIKSNAHVNEYKLSLCNLYQDSDSTWYAYLCFRTTGSASLNMAFADLKFWNQQLYTCRNYKNNTPLSSPTVNAEANFN